MPSSSSNTSSLNRSNIMTTIQVKVSDYYGVPSYYSVMPRPIFDALEAATLNGEEYIDVEKALFDTMIDNYNKKMGIKKEYKRCTLNNSL